MTRISLIHIVKRSDAALAVPAIMTAVLGTTAIAAQNKYSLKIPNGLVVQHASSGTLI